MSDRLSILQHSLGVDQYGQGDQYRSHYVAGPNSDVWPLLNAMVAEGLMVRRGPSELFGNDYCFVVTQSGAAHVKHNSPSPPKLTRSQRRYREFLSAESGMSFIDWLRSSTKRHGPCAYSVDKANEQREGETSGEWCERVYGVPAQGEF